MGLPQIVLEILVRLLFYIILMIIVLITVAFVTLIEQKVLGGLQIRVGPSKVGYWGLLQPFADAVKLFIKEPSTPRMRSLFFFFLMPVLALFVSLFLWLVFPFIRGGLRFELGLMFFICVRGLGVFPIIAAGWLSNSKYSLLGGLRAVAQIISYEVRLVLVLLSLIWVRGSFNFLLILRGLEWC
jgi:NADH-ubiquinone oxidoreductase chain 1